MSSWKESTPTELGAGNPQWVYFLPLPITATAISYSKSKQEMKIPSVEMNCGVIYEIFLAEIDVYQINNIMGLMLFS